MTHPLDRRDGRRARGSLALHTLIWLLCFSMIVPPAALAQFGGSPGSPQAPQAPLPLPQFGASTAPMQGQPVVTNPTALQPLAAAQPPCPAPRKPSEGIDPTPPTLNELWPMETGTLLPTTVQERMRQERVGREEAQERERQEREQQELIRQQELQRQREAELQQPQAVAKALAGALPGAGGQATPPTGAAPQIPRVPRVETQAGRDFSVEEAFAQFSVLQGVKGRLKQFGYDFFDVQASTFAPVIDVPVGPDYVIGPQDSLSIHIWNVPDQNYNRSYIAPVERDGTIVIPQLGAVPVGGLTFSQAEKAIHGRLASVLKRFEVHVAMARLRTIKVYVVGEVVRPGAYELSALATVSNAVYAACGPARSGSLRSVQVVRDGKPVASLDFYDFLIKGDRRQDLRLQSGDVVTVPPLGPVVAIDGAVKRPAIYELSAGGGLVELLGLAGGLTSLADRERCHVFRIEPGQGRVLVDVDLKAILSGAGSKAKEGARKDFPLSDGDFVRIASLPTQAINVVSLAGAVKHPGPYEFRPGMRVSDLLTPDQLLVDAYRERAEIIRTDLVTYQAQVIPFSPAALFEGQKDEDLELQRLDQIVVATQLRKPSIVVVEGEVRRPGRFTIEVGERLSSVLKRAGGLTAQAYPQGIVLIRPSVRRAQQSEVEKFVIVQKQKLLAESAALAAGGVGLPGTGLGLHASPEQAVLQMQLQALDQLAARVQPGRVVIRMDSIAQLERSLDDVVLEDGDQITMPPVPNTVNVIGAVRNPSSLVYQEGLGVDGYLTQAGGMMDTAKEKDIYILRANGSSELTHGKFVTVGRGDTIVVPEELEPKTRPLPLWTALASIFGSIMLAVAGITVISTR